MSEVQAAPPVEKKMRNSRRSGGAWIIVLGIASVAAQRYYGDFAALLTGRDPTQIADLGPDILQPMFVAISYVCMGLLLSLIVATLMEKWLRPDAFGTFSRFGFSLILCFAGYCFLAGSIL